MEAVPLELFHYIMNFFADADMRRIALVSRGFRSAAISHKYFCIGWRPRPAILAYEVNDFCERLDHALELQLPFAVEWELIAVSDWRSTMEPTFRRINQGFHLVVKLVIVIPPDCSDMLEYILHTPAPRLRELKITTIDFIKQDCPFPLPLDLFQGYAPQLTTLTTVALSIVTDPCPTTAAVKKLCIGVRKLTSLIPLSWHFPVADSITLTFHDEDQPLNIDLGGFSRLTSLTFEDLLPSTASSWIPSCTDISYIPQVSWKFGESGHYIYNDEQHKWLWVGVTGNISMQIFFVAEFYEAAVSVHGSHGRTRNLIFPHDMQSNSTCIIPYLGNIFAESLTDVRTCGSYLAEWLKLDNVKFPVLERLHVDIMNDLDFQYLVLRASPIPCNKLCVVIVESLGIDDTVSNILATDVATIGRNLAQADRLPGERAALETLGISFLDDPAVLDSVFSSTLFGAEFPSSYGKPLDLLHLRG